MSDQVRFKVHMSVERYYIQQCCRVRGLRSATIILHVPQMFLAVTLVLKFRISDDLIRKRWSESNKPVKIDTNCANLAIISIELKIAIYLKYTIVSNISKGLTVPMSAKNVIRGQRSKKSFFRKR